MNYLRSLCGRIIENDRSLTEILACSFSHRMLNVLLQSLEANRVSNHSHPLHVRHLALICSEWSPSSLLKLLSYLCQSSGYQEEDADVGSVPGLKSLSIQLKVNGVYSRENFVELFEGIAADQPPGLGDLDTLHFTQITRGVLGKLSAVALAGALSSPIAHVMHLTIDNFRMSDEMIGSICTGLASNCCSLRTLKLEYCDLSDGGAEAIAGVLGELSTLKELSLRRNHIGNIGAIAFSKALSGENRSLVKFDMGANNVRDEGGLALITAIRTHPALEFFSLQDNKQNKKSAEGLVESIPHLLAIKYLHFGPLSTSERFYINRYNSVRLEQLRQTWHLMTTRVGDFDAICKFVACFDHIVHDQFTLDWAQKLAKGMEQNFSMISLKLSFMIDEPNTYGWFATILDEASRHSSLFLPTRWFSDPPMFRAGILLVDYLIFTSFFLNLNRFGIREIFFGQNLLIGLWPRIISQCKQSSSLLYYIIREHPYLVKEKCKTKKRKLATESF